MRKVVGVLLLIGLIATVCVFFTHSAHYGKKNNPIDFRPVYLSNVSLNARFSNEGPGILVVQYSDIEKAPINLSKPVLVVGEINVTRLLITFNITTPLASIEPSPKAVFVYNRGLLFLESGDVRKFLVWTREVIRYEAHWSFGIYSEHSGILLAVRSSHIEPPKNWSSVGGTLPEYFVSVEITVPGNENVELSLVPLNGKLSNYHPTTSKGQTSPSTTGRAFSGTPRRGQ
ncbi:hypothetical protein [Thermococcus gammatolerans]|uniref:Uncharacterized protein n=1 Tax=Thermococcus gammatolerans (strain DSM 15229 / JCM 11827 / EJ3) TaxID=593117 RepID=C5A4U2_THEGJ|nr:hypothetical protein [Thermococcus gammatolerans]ACS33254.1 Hypothetical protein TGAM_0752 [Thermococcus gammatolerans EJ3]